MVYDPYGPGDQSASPFDDFLARFYGSPRRPQRIDIGDAQLFADPRCKGLIMDFEEVVFKPDSSVIDKDKDSQRTHLSDALGYLLWQECRPRTAFGEQDRRLI